MADWVRAVASRSSGSVHMLGIGGVGMAGLALLLKSRGWRVTGCDVSEGPLLAWLRRQGIAVSIGHDPIHLESAPDVLVRSPAVHVDEPELQEARRLEIPVIDRGRLLPALMDRHDVIAVAGTHGKTTTSSMIAWILHNAGIPVSYCIGGVCPGLGAVAAVREGGWMVIEADESDGTLRHYRPRVAVITSMDLDHVDYFSTAEALDDVYGPFARAAERAIYPGADRQAACLLTGREGATSFGLENDADWSAARCLLDAAGSTFDVMHRGELAGSIALGVSGRHNMLNALAAIAATRPLGVEWPAVARALATFQLPRRRYERVAEGRGITVISDYAHHPAEIAALLQQASMEKRSRTIGVFQPHRYSRTKAFGEGFLDVLARLDHIVLAPVYAASEPEIEGGTSEDLAAAARRRGFQHLELADSVAAAWERLRAVWRAGDLVLIIGAGDVEVIGTWAREALAEGKQST